MNLFEAGAKLGPIRGIFIVYKGDVSSRLSFNSTVGVVANMDLISRNLCNELE